MSTSEKTGRGKTTFKHTLVCVNTEATEGEKEDKRQHKNDASLK